MERSPHCTHPEQAHCDCDACRYVAKLRAELKHARVQMRRARGREQVTAINMGHCLPSIKYVRLHALALASLQKWSHRVLAAKRSLGLMGLDETKE